MIILQGYMSKMSAGNAEKMSESLKLIDMEFTIFSNNNAPDSPIVYSCGIIDEFEVDEVLAWVDTDKLLRMAKGFYPFVYVLIRFDDQRLEKSALAKIEQNLNLEVFLTEEVVGATSPHRREPPNIILP